MTLQDIKTYAYRFPLPAHESFPALKDHMRTHAQFFMLIREHAQLVADDTQLYKVFRQHCAPSYDRCALSLWLCAHLQVNCPLHVVPGARDCMQVWVLVTCRHGHLCVPDEQYFGTVLSYKLASHERLWTEVCPEPVLYMLKAEDGIDPEFITLDFLMEARGTVPRENATRLDEAGARSGIPFGQCQASEW